MTLAEDIINKADIVDVIGRYVSLTKAGSNYKGLCPFHGEKSPSFVVSPHKQIFKCFGCGVGGDVITFIKEIEHVEFMEAAKILAKDASIDIADYQDKAFVPKNQDEKEKLIEMNKAAKTYFVQELKKSPDALDYVRSRRGLSDEVIAHFGIGYGPDHYYQMTEYLKTKGYTAQEQIKGSLAKNSQRGDTYAFYRDRIIFPIYDVRSRVIGFGGRAMGADTQPKYVNTTDTLIYDKSSVLYGINWAKSAVREQGSIIVVEGYMDVIALHRLGYQAAVATCGTALTATHIQTLKKYTDRVVLLFDQDKAGFEATKRALALAYAQDIYPVVMTLADEYKDVDDLAQAVDQGQTPKTDLMTQTTEGLLFVIEHLRQSIDPRSPIDKKRLLDDVFSLVAMVSSLSIQQHYLGIIAEELSMTDMIIIAEFQTYVRGHKRRLQQQMRHQSTQSEKQEPQTFRPSEDDLLAAVLADHRIVDQLPDVEAVASLVQRGSFVAEHYPQSLLTGALSGELTDEQQSTIADLQLRRENERSTLTEPSDRYAHFLRVTGTSMQRITQTILKLLPSDQKGEIVQLLRESGR